MENLIKVKCVACEGRYYVVGNDINLMLPKDIEPGEAFPNSCPLCEDGGYAVLVDKQ